MTTPQPPESKSAAPRLIGLYRFSAVEFLIALVLLFIGIAFVEQLDKGINGSVKTPLRSLILATCWYCPEASGAENTR
jgi:hypothetical protein